MKDYRTILIMLLFCLGMKSYGQIEVIANKVYSLDTLKTNSVSLNLDLLLYVSDNEMDQFTEIRVANSALFNYLFRNTDIELTFRQIIERQDDGSFYFNHYLMLSSGIYKYKPIDKKRTMLRKFYPEPIFIVQNNSDRGLRWRFQIGVLFHPWAIIRPKFKLNFGLGFVYDWSSWEVNNMDKIDAVSSGLKDKILFINSHIKLRKNMYQDHSEFRPMLLLNLDYKINNILRLAYHTSFQQSLTSPYNKEITTVYPELKKVYPYILLQFEFYAMIYKGISLKFAAGLDYENNNLSLYESSWGYSLLFGVAWNFSNQKIR